MQKNPFTQIQPWIGCVLHEIKKDIKTEHLPSERQFYKTYFGSRPLNKLTIDEIFSAYEKELLAGNEGFVDWAINRWIFKHGDIYRHFAEKLMAINPNFQEIATLDQGQAEAVLKGALESFGARDVYLFARLNGVVLPEEVFEELNRAALAQKEEERLAEETKSSQESLEQMIAKHQREMSRVQEKYEDKLAGVQRKYTQDVEALKKQVRALQQQLQRTQ